VILLHVVAGADTPLAQDARGVVDEKDGRRGVELAPAGQRLRLRRRVQRLSEDVELKADALVLRKSESASFAVYWNGTEYKSYQLSD